MDEWEAAFERMAAIAYTLPGTHEVTKWGRPMWAVADKQFAWMRPLSKADLKRFAEAGEEPPTGPLLAIRTDGLEEKEAILQEGTPGFFTIEHFKNYPGVLIALDEAEPGDVQIAIEDAWLAVAPKDLVTDFLNERNEK